MGRTELDCEIVGEGRDLVLLHSLLSDRTGFAALAVRLAGQRRLIMPNLPGFGGSPGGAATVEALAEAVAGLFDDLDLSASTDLLGNGLGGFVGLAFAAGHGARFERLVLLGSAVAFPEAGRATFRGLAAKVEAEGMAAVADAAMARMFPEGFIAAHPALILERANVFRGIDPGVFAAACRALAELDLAPDLPRIANPTLIVAGEADQATPPALGRTLAGRLARAELIELPGIGHAPHLQDPDRLIAAIAPFLGIER